MIQSTSVVPTGGRLRGHLIKGAAGSFVLQVGFAGFAFLNAIILARVLGAEGYGTFVNAMAWVSLLTIPATFGFGILLVRDTAIYRSQAKWGLLKGLLRFSNRWVLVLSITLALLAALVAGVLFHSENQATMRHTLWIALGLLPLFALYNLHQATMRGLEHVIVARLPGMIVRPGLLLAGIVSLYYLLPKLLSAPMAMAVNVGAGAITLALGIFFLHKLLPGQVKTAKAAYTPSLWLKAAFPMLVYGGAQIVLGQTDIVMLGAMRGAHDVGLYAAANRLAFLLTYVMMASNMILAPVMSRLYRNGEKDRLRKLITKVTRISFWVVLPLGLILVFTSNNLLGLLFGHDFLSAQIALIILTIAQLGSVALGPYIPILSMTGFQSKVPLVIVPTAFLNIILNMFWIPVFGINGAAVATSISTITSAVLLSYFCLNYPNINSTILGKKIHERNVC